MDVTLLNENSLKVKGKNASIVVNPNSSTGKTEADAILFLGSSDDQSVAKIEGSRITIKGPGEYEVAGVKVSTTVIDDQQVAKIDVDGVKVLIGSGSSIEKMHDKIEEAQILVVNSNNEFNHSTLTSLEPNVLILYGDKRMEVAKSLGKEETLKATKYSTTADKLPQEMEVILLGN